MALSVDPEFWSAVSLLGSPVTMALLCVALAGTLAARGRLHAAVAVALAQGGGGLLNVTLKNLVRRPRPPGSELLLHGFSWSFPSGHAMGSLIGYGMLCCCLVRYWHVAGAARNSVCIAAALTVIAIGTSRIQLGVHYPGDVFGGYLIGAAWLAIVISVLRRTERPPVSSPMAPAR